MSLAPVRPANVPSAPAGELPGTRLVTGEAIVMDIRIARLGSRMLARLLDLCLQIAIGYLLFFVLSLVVGLASALDPASIATIAVSCIVASLVGYPVMMETLTRGRTLGKLAMGLRVVRDDGGPIRFRQALARTLVGISAEIPGVLPPLTWFACIGTMLASPEGKRLGDIAAGTIVIHERTPETWGWVPAMPPQLASWAATLDLTGVGDPLALAVRNYLARNRKLREPARTRLGAELAAEVAARVSPPAPAGTPGWAYLAAVLAERHQRSLARIGRARASTAAVWPELAALSAPVPWSQPSAPPPPTPAHPGWPPVRPAVPGGSTIAG